MQEKSSLRFHGTIEYDAINFYEGEHEYIYGEESHYIRCDRFQFCDYIEELEEQFEQANNITAYYIMMNLNDCGDYDEQKNTDRVIDEMTKNFVDFLTARELA